MPTMNVNTMCQSAVWEGGSHRGNPNQREKCYVCVPENKEEHKRIQVVPNFNLQLVKQTCHSISKCTDLKMLLSMNIQYPCFIVGINIYICLYINISLHERLPFQCTPAQCRIECTRVPKAQARTAECKPKWREVLDFVIT